MPNFGTRNDMISFFHQTLTLAKGRAAPDFTYGKVGVAKVTTLFEFENALFYAVKKQLLYLSIFTLTLYNKDDCSIEAFCYLTLQTVTGVLFDTV